MTTNGSTIATKTTHDTPRTAFLHTCTSFVCKSFNAIMLSGTKHFPWHSALLNCSHSQGSTSGDPHKRSAHCQPTFPLPFFEHKDSYIATKTNHDTPCLDPVHTCKAFIYKPYACSSQYTCAHVQFLQMLVPQALHVCMHAAILGGGKCFAPPPFSNSCVRKGPRSSIWYLKIVLSI